jgi:hypothetical protein
LISKYFLYLNSMQKFTINSLNFYTPPKYQKEFCIIHLHQNYYFLLFFIVFLTPKYSLLIQSLIHQLNFYNLISFNFKIHSVQEVKLFQSAFVKTLFLLLNLHNKLLNFSIFLLNKIYIPLHSITIILN